MQMIYGSHGKRGGIYKITNSLNGRVYIGSAKHFSKRWNQHRVALLKGRHSNKFLQKDFDKCLAEQSNDNFLVFEIVQVIEGVNFQEERFKAEQSFIDELFDKCITCYNMQKRVSAFPVNKGKAFRHKSETKELIANSSRERWADPDYKTTVIQKMKEAGNTPEAIAKKKEEQKKIKEQREADPIVLEQYKRSCSEHAKKIWAQGLIKETEESRKNKSLAAKKRIAEGKSPHLAHNSFKQTKVYQVMTPEGSVIQVDNAKEFAAKNNIPLLKFRCMCYGKIKSCNGYVLFSEKEAA